MVWAFEFYNVMTKERYSHSPEEPILIGNITVDEEKKLVVIEWVEA